jgi:hypothetical protein
MLVTAIHAFPRLRFLTERARVTAEIVESSLIAVSLSPRREIG